LVGVLWKDGYKTSAFRPKALPNVVKSMAWTNVQDEDCLPAIACPRSELVKGREKDLGQLVILVEHET
jgi:hypothetical protein